MIIKYNLEVVKSKKIFLNKELVKSCFRLREGTERYLSSGISIVLLVSGEDTRFKLYKLKNKIRKKYKCTNLLNLLHSADDGLEYDRQFNVFFPNLNLSKFTGNARIGFLPKENFNFMNVKNMSHLYIFLDSSQHKNIYINKVETSIYYTLKKKMEHGKVYSYQFYNLQNDILYCDKKILYIKESLFNKKYFDQEFDWILYDSKISLHDFYDLHDFIDARDTEVKSIIVGEYSENLYHSCIGKNELKKAEAKNER